MTGKLGLGISVGSCFLDSLCKCAESKVFSMSQKNGWSCVCWLQGKVGLLGVWTEFSNAKRWSLAPGFSAVDGG